jgi:hypothetical protein|tara:strand:+ start:50 stop:640 length:591 start_codon:yes stop_codon:yes gene_type:complete
MANQDAAFGLRPLKTLGQQDDSTGMSSHKILPGDASILYQGSMAVANTNGYVDISSATSTLNIGAFWGCYYVDPTTLKPTFKNYYPGSITPPSSGAIEAFVYDSPYQEFEVQSDATGASAQADIFMCCDTSSPTAGSTSNGISSMESADSFAAGPAQLKVIGVSRDPENSDLTSANVNWRVQICEHIFGSGTTGTA